MAVNKLTAQKAAAEIIMRCFEARTIAHILHLRTRCYEAHVALNEFYDGIVPLTDAFAEAFQGVFDIIPSYPKVGAYDQGKDYKEGVALLVELRGAVEKLRSDIPGTELQNLVDEILGFIDQKAYKLRFLK